MKICLVGSGVWGKNYISAISTVPNIELEIASRLNWKDKINEYPDGVIICTPPHFHIEIADLAMSKGIPTMIEKPLSLSLAEAKQIDKYKVPVLVNHIHLFSEGYQCLKKIITAQHITSIFSEGYNQSVDRNYSALWDFGPHDLAMILDLTNQFPNSIDIIQTNLLYNIKLTFDNCLTESIVGNKADNKRRFFSVNFNGLNISYDDLQRPTRHSAPLANALKVFIDAINGEPDERLGLALSFKIIEILESCQKILSIS